MPKKTFVVFRLTYLTACDNLSATSAKRQRTKGAAPVALQPGTDEGISHPRRRVPGHEARLETQGRHFDDTPGIALRITGRDFTLKCLSKFIQALIAR